MTQPLITLDGPSGSGKSTLAHALAATLGWYVLDTGTLYRALAWVALERGLGDSSAEVLGAVPGLSLRPERVGHSLIHIEGLDDRSLLQRPEVSERASRVSALPELRAALLDLQRSVRELAPVVAEGRDCGTVVFPDAALKAFVTADLDARARRRSVQLGEAATNVASTQRALDARDARDRGRSIAPLARADDAMLIDTTHASVEDCVAKLVDAARTRGLLL